MLHVNTNQNYDLSSMTRLQARVYFIHEIKVRIPEAWRNKSRSSRLWCRVVLW